MAATGYEQVKELAGQVTNYMEQAHKPKSAVPEDARRLLTTLKEEGYNLTVVSNRQKPYQKEMEELDLVSF